MVRYYNLIQNTFAGFDYQRYLDNKASKHVCVALSPALTGNAATVAEGRSDQELSKQTI